MSIWHWHSFLGCFMCARFLWFNRFSLLQERYLCPLGNAHQSGGSLGNGYTPHNIAGKCVFICRTKQNVNLTLAFILLALGCVMSVSPILFTLLRILILCSYPGSAASQVVLLACIQTTPSRSLSATSMQVVVCLSDFTCAISFSRFWVISLTESQLATPRLCVPLGVSTVSHHSVVPLRLK